MSEENLLGGVLQAQVRVEGLPASRQIVAVERQLDGTWRVCGSGQSNTDGLAQLAVQAQAASAVYALALDSWGKPWSANMVVAVGDVVRPTTFVGWVYRATTAGTLPEAEPTWWNSAQAGPLPVGTAALEAERYYQPIAHGPVSVEFVEDFDPLWLQVVALLHGDGPENSNNIIDETGRIWTANGDTKIVAGAVYFDGAGDSLTTPASEDFNFGVGPLCWEFKIKAASVQPQTFPCCLSFGVDSRWGANGVQVHILRGDSYGNKLTVWIYNYNPSSPMLKSTFTLLDDLEHDVAITRSGNTFRLFIDGVIEDSKTWDGSVANAAVGCALGSAGSSDQQTRAKASMQEVRFTIASRYTATYQPSAEPFLSQ